MADYKVGSFSPGCSNLFRSEVDHVIGLLNFQKQSLLGSQEVG